MGKKQVVGVFCTEHDIQDKTVVEIALRCGIISECDIDSDGIIHYSEESLKKVLHFLFGFYKGFYEVEVIENQRTRIGNLAVKNMKRYVGTERQDKDWVESAMCSQQTREIVKWGTVL